ncbi:envelope membrane protein (plastid) [Cryptomonas paramecium]|uniref:Envelope membrane protein n=1 Tax=Cryptomonas paramaecium TaxID=2898 RepID=D2IS68_9CRYP|nr:envelope membrane protein [Cryptomonas paramecium]ACT46760.1 envelope membrane protein [Cryptomonas paramecium]BDA98036.1 envelope membrane protein [Cryptomonas paramecium]
MKNWRSDTLSQSAFEKTGPIPRSISRTFEKFKKELNPNTETEIVEELRVSRYQTSASIKYLLLLLISPILINQISRNFVFSPVIDYFWSEKSTDIFLNTSQEERAFSELHRFEEKIHFEMLIGQLPSLSQDAIEKELKNKAVELAQYYSYESTSAIKNLLSDIMSFTTFTYLIITGRRQISVLKSFINEIIYELSDTAKAFLIILFTNVFVGFHSTHGWEVLLENGLRHFGLPENRDAIFLFIATFPVFLDTMFKYWIFRYLNQVSPSAVATYHEMNE